MERLFTASHRGGSGEPLVLLHGFTDSWRTWELVLPRLERDHDVFAPTLPGHAGGPPLPQPQSGEAIVDALEAQLDDAGLETAHLAGNSLGGYLALQLASRGRARSVVALAPAGGHAAGDGAIRKTLRYFLALHEPLQQAAPHADAIAASVEGRRRATEMIAVNWEHIPADLIAHQIAAAAATSVRPMVELAQLEDYPLATDQIECPVRIVWGTEDRLLELPAAAARYREQLPQADWVVLDDVGHCPQLDVPLAAAELIAGFGR